MGRRKENGSGWTNTGRYFGSSELLRTSVVFVVCANGLVLLAKEEAAFHGMIDRLIGIGRRSAMCQRLTSW
jgi:hypothetical protein